VAAQATLAARLDATVAALPTSVAATVAALPTITPVAGITTPAPPSTGGPRPSASTEPTTPTPAPTSLPGVGQRVESTGLVLTVNAVRKAIRAGTRSTPKPGQAFLIADVTLENTGTAAESYNPLQFAVQDADGLEYIASLAGADEALHAGELAPGKTASGEVIFEVPITARGLVLHYRPPAGLGGDDVMRVALGQ
jgi:hypothetical protein